MKARALRPSRLTEQGGHGDVNVAECVASTVSLESRCSESMWRCVLAPVTVAP